MITWYICFVISSGRQNICITFVQCSTNVKDVRPTLHKCQTNMLCLLRYQLLLFVKNVEKYFVLFFQNVFLHKPLQFYLHMEPYYRLYARTYTIYETLTTKKLEIDSTK